MDKQIEELLGKYSDEIKNLYNNLRQIVYDSAKGELTESLWARLPSYYLGDRFVRLIPFKDHINVEAVAVIHHKDELLRYKITPKGMLQIYVDQDVPFDALKRIFEETLRG